MLTDTLDIAPNDEPQPFVICVSNSSGTETDETILYTDTASKVDSDVIDSKTDTATEGEI